MSLTQQIIFVYGKSNLRKFVLLVHAREVSKIIGFSICL